LNPEEYTNCSYSVVDFDISTETIPYEAVRTIPVEEFNHWHLPKSSSRKSRKIDSVETLDIFNSHINRTLAETRDVSRWLVNQLTASFDVAMIGNDKRQLIRKEIDYQSWSLAKICADLREGLGFHHSTDLRSRTKTSTILDSIASELHVFLFSACSL
jgi:CRISPR/Cas system Type II protein with McrA/HNH and RuvC-like nuclease domain